MDHLTPDISAEVVNVCQANAAEAAEAMGRALEATVTLSVGQAGTVDLATLPQWMGGSGLAVVLTVGETGALVLIPGQSGILPGWCEHPDATGQSKLATLAQELGMLLLPDRYLPQDFQAGHVKSLHAAAARGGLVGAAAMVPLNLEAGDGTRSTAALMWPLTKPFAVLATAAKAESKPAETVSPDPPTANSARTTSTQKPRAVSPDALPQYARSLLRIKVPVVVTLARKRQPLGSVIELGPGAIIQFDKSCEEMLELDVGGRLVATGEAVKVGDKFGLRIKSVVLPEERFQPIKPKVG